MLSDNKMISIKQGYGGKPLVIKINGTEGNQVSQLWIEYTELADNQIKAETLSYITLEELLELKKEIDNAVRCCFSMSKEI